MPCLRRCLFVVVCLSVTCKLGFGSQGQFREPSSKTVQRFKKSDRLLSSVSNMHVDFRGLPVEEWDSYLDNWSTHVAPGANAISPQQLQLDGTLGVLSVTTIEHWGL